jgi:hypothetical protein
MASIVPFGAFRLTREVWRRIGSFTRTELNAWRRGGLARSFSQLFDRRAHAFAYGTPPPPHRQSTKNDAQ